LVGAKTDVVQTTDVVVLLTMSALSPTAVVLLPFYSFSIAPHWLTGLNRRGGELRDVGCLTDV